MKNMAEYKKLHDSLTRRLISSVLDDKKPKISILNSNNMILTSITLFIVFFLFTIIYVLYKSNFILLIQASEETLIHLKNILSVIFIVLLYSILTFWYVFYVFKLFHLLRKRENIILDNTFYKELKIFLILCVTFFIILIVFLLFDDNLVLFNELSEKYSKWAVYGYFILFSFSLLLLIGEYLYKYRKDFLELLLLIMLTIFPHVISYRITPKKVRKMISQEMWNIDTKELNEINAYLIYWNKIENIIKVTWIILGVIYFSTQIIIWEISLNKQYIITLIKKDVFFSLTLFILFVLLFFIYKIFFTTAFLRNSYYIFTKETRNDIEL